MRRLALILGLAATLIGAPAGAQFSLFGVGEGLVQFALRQISSEGFRIEAAGIEEGEDGSAELVDVRVSDAVGVWLTIDAVVADWSASRLLRGEIAIDRLAARGVEVLRAPEPLPTPEDEEIEEEVDGDLFEWPRAPIAVVVEEMALDGVTVAPGVIAEQGISFTATGSARDQGAEQAADLLIERTDEIEGTISLDYLRNFDTGVLNVDLDAREAPGGLVASLAGFPEDSASRLELTAQGPLTDWDVTLDAEAERVFTADGSATVEFGPPFLLDAELIVRPGPEAPPAVAAALGEEATLIALAEEGQDNVIRVQRGAISAPELTAEVSGFLNRATGELDFDANINAGGGLSDLVDGVRWSRIAFNGEMTGSLSDLSADGALALDGLETAPADVGRARLNANVDVAGETIDFNVDGQTSGVRLDRIQPATFGEATIAARGVWNGEAATLETFSIDSPLLSAEASGTADIAGGDLSLTYQASASSLEPIAQAYDVQAGGAFLVDGQVEGSPERPQVIGEAALERLTYQGEPFGRVALSHDVALGETPQGRVALIAEGSRYGPARIATDFIVLDDGTELRLTDFNADVLGATATGNVAYDLSTGLADGQVQAELSDLAPLSRLAGEEATGTASLSVTLTPQDGAQGVAVDADVSNFAAFDARVDSLAIDLRAADALGPGLAAEGTVAGSGLAAAGAEIASFDAAIDAANLASAPSGELTATVQGVSFPAAEARIETLRLTAQGENLIDAPRVDATLTAEAIAAAGATVDRATLDVVATDLLGSPEADAELVATDIAYPPADARIARLQIDAEGRNLIDAPAIDASLSATDIAAAQATVASLSAELTGEDLTGSPEATIDLTARDVAYPPADARVASLRLEAEGQNLIESPSIDATLTAETVAGGGAQVASLTVDAQGSNLIDAPEATVAATLRSIVVGGARSAQATLNAELSQTDGGARLVADLDAAALTTGEARIGPIALDATVNEALSENPLIDARLRVAGAEAGPASISEATATAQGRLSSLAATVAAAGETERGEPISLELAARANATAEPPQVALDSLDARFGDAFARLRAPLSISAGEPLALRGLELELPGGEITGDVSLFPSGLRGDLVLAFPDLRPLADIADAPIAAGSLLAQASFDTRPGPASAAIDARAEGLVFTETTEGLEGFDLTLDGDWNGRSFDVTALLGGPFERPLQLTASVPLRATSGIVPATPPGTPIDARVEWSGRIGDLWALVPAPNHVLDGFVTLDLAVTGPIAAPQIAGTLALAEGQYQFLTTGTILTGLTVDSEAMAGGGFAITAEAEDGSGNPVTARIELVDGVLDADLGARQAVLVRRDDVTAALTLDIAADGPLASPAITGEIEIDKAEVRLIDATPPSVATLGDIRIKGEPIVEEEEGAGAAIPLDISVYSQRDIFVRGRGLTSEWRVDLEIGGTAAEPEIVGVIEKVRGELLLVGATFELETGRIIFSGEQPIDPRIDVALLRETDTIRGGVVVRGTVSDPEIAFESTPPLPEEEVLPRVLFDKSQQSLSAAEAIQLAAGVATLLDGTGGVLDQFRAAAGVDVLAVEGLGESAAVRVGKNVGDGVFVGARQPLDGGSTSVVVEIELFDNVSVDSEVGADTGTSVGVNWKMDF